MLHNSIRVVTVAGKEVDKSTRANSSSTSTSISLELTDTVGHMEVVITLVKVVALQPKVTNLMPLFKTRWEAVQPTASDGVEQK
eukprot:10570023-Ditylum_brightwellii.AAC.1